MPHIGGHTSWKAGTERMLGALLCLLLAFSLGAVTPQKAYALNYQEGPAASACDRSWYSDGGTYFTISTAEQLAGLAFLVTEGGKTFEGKTVALANDIDLSGICAGCDWRPIGLGMSYVNGPDFMGTFDGGGHRISGLRIDNSKYDNALFGSVRRATIKNLTVSGEVYGSDYAAGIISCCEDSDLENLVNECTVDAVRYNAGTAHEGRAAGVVCYAATAYPTGNRTYRNLVNKGTIRSTSYYTAGCVGFLYNATGYSTSLVNCANYGSVTAQAARYGLDSPSHGVGGVLGATAGDYGTYNLVGCYNEGDVGSENLLSNGGVAGYLGGLGSTFNANENEGPVAGPNNTGGLVGFFGSSGGTATGNLNLGSVSGGTAAGIVGGASSGTMANNYTRAATAPLGYGGGVGVSNDGTARTDADLKSQSFLDMLNAGTTNFSITAEHEFPGLSWMLNVMNPGAGGDPTPVDPTDPNYQGNTGRDPQSTPGEQAGGGSGVANEAPQQYEREAFVETRLLTGEELDDEFDDLIDEDLLDSEWEDELEDDELLEQVEEEENEMAQPEMVEVEFVEQVQLSEAQELIGEAAQGSPIMLVALVCLLVGGFGYENIRFSRSIRPRAEAPSQQTLQAQPPRSSQQLYPDN